VLLASVSLLHLSNPLTWGETGLGLWYPPAGLGLVLIAWFGPRAALWVAIDGLLVVSQVVLWSLLGAGQRSGVEPVLACMDAVLGAVLLQASWWLYHDQARGARGLGEPRSAMRFLFLVPGIGMGLWAVLHTALSGWTTGWSAELWKMSLPAFWLSRALGVLVVAPLLLVVLTPWLSRRGFVGPETMDAGPKEPLDVVGGGERLTWGDGLEIAGLAAGAGALTWLAVQNGRASQVGWQLWGAPLLLIVWASLRQGLRGSTLVAGASAGLPLALLEDDPVGALFALLVQGNLLGQCAVALLVAASTSWVRGREGRYRQVMAHVPVVIYSARFCRPGRPPLSGGDLAAEVTLVSAASEALLGCPPGELLGDWQNWLQSVHPDDREVVHAAIAQVGRQDQLVTCEYRLAEIVDRESWIVDRDDKRTTNVRWVRDTLAPRLDADRQLIGWEGVLTDITEQRVLADDLRRTTSMLHALVGNLPAGVFFVQGPRGRPILVNARARQLLGRREDMAAGLEHLAEVYRLHRPDGTLYPVEELPVYLALRKGLTTMRDDIVVHWPDGRRVPLVAWAAPVQLVTRGSWIMDREETSHDSRPDAAVWVLEDLTTLHQAEAARRDTEGRLRAILETMAEGLIVQDQAGCIIDCNSTAGAVLGHPSERLRGMTLAERDWSLLREDGTPLPPDEYPAALVLHLGRPVRNLVLGIVKHHPPSDARSPKSEAIRWVLVNAMPLGGGAIGDNRGTAGVVTTYVDISAYVQAQKTIRASEEKYRELVESLPLMVIQADTEMRVTYSNPATQSITGYDLAEIADPQAWCALVHPDDLPLMLALARAALEGTGGRAEFRYRAKDGSEKVGLAFAEPRRRPDGVIVGTTSLIVDLTRERQLEQDLLRAQRMELVGRLSSGIAHDFNNLLCVVLSLTELVRSSLPADHAGHADLERIQEATEQAANLANQLLTFSKQRRATARRIEINGVARRTLELLRASLPPTIVLKTELAEQDLFIRADETQVQQVLMNLCLNGRDAMPEGGQLHIRTAWIGGERDGVLLSVADNGTGMSDAVKARLFDPFFSTKERGTGLGLAVVQQIVESNGGRVEVFSEVGRGTRFDVWWPVSCEEDTATP
jgi:PAS domain S-box-containing protein